MRKGFISDIVFAAIGRNIAPLGFILISGNDVQSCAVNESPITESDVEAGVYKGGTVTKGVFNQGSCHFSLIRVIHEFLSSTILHMVVEEGRRGFC